MATTRETRISRWLTLGANLAVLLGLLSVGLELKNSRATAEAQTADGIADGFLQLNLATISDGTVGRIWVQGLAEPDSLSDTEAIRFSMYMRGLFNQFTRVHRLYAAGLLGEADWALLAQEAAHLMDTPGGRLYFEGNDLGAAFLADLEPYRGMPPNIDLWLGRKK